MTQHHNVWDANGQNEETEIEKAARMLMAVEKAAAAAQVSGKWTLFPLKSDDLLLKNDDFCVRRPCE